MISKGGSTIASATECSSLLSKFRGLMFSRKRNLLFEFSKPQRVSLHMLFVFFPIWAVYLDEEKKVQYVQKLLPFLSTFAPEGKAKYVLELVGRSRIRVGDVLTW
ncbi:DUF192 domain-containing protein [Candidatus Woesearchaeota archaeon]|nr:DUF192 domain-containing protein [Candidatus Woesearchaeota archaeon]